MTVETTLYTTLIGDDEPIEELPADIISYGYRLNRPGAIRFDLSLDHEFCNSDVVAPGVHEAVVVRNRAVVWRGPVLTAQETDTDTERKVSFGGEGLFAYMRRWFLTSTISVTNTDLAAIARSLIDHHQDKAGGDFGLDTSGSEATRNGDRTYYGWERKNIYDAICQLAEVDNGFDFHIDPETRRFVAHYPMQGGRKPDLVWADGIRSFGRSIDATVQASQVLGVGEGEGEDMLLRNRQGGGAVAQYGLTQAVFTNKDVKEPQTLIDQVVREQARSSQPAQTVAVTIGTDTYNPFSFGLGVEGRLVYPSSYHPVNEFRRLVGFDVVWEQGDERAVLHLQEVGT